MSSYLGREDPEGFFTVVGRIKEIIITAGGENVAPTNIEDEIKKELAEVLSQIDTCPSLVFKGCE